ncbi:NAD(P)/FAD-dependent oxidoreductase [Mesorhizobium sp. L-8-3]|uniref:NAD(P)/FAD-dependent oxidoreductase n=1 Tax=Mesorhizobium sp. L-8-3 TaxID=2744522 RepID=UPI0019281EDD|nr:NAD(P)/FAD-dependent oxidoreductase [Mesorhizobium sp. L-8-3]BCH20880.1 NADH dehydrogenase [Mesorhizobium sp. L-8-3]
MLRQSIEAAAITVTEREGQQEKAGTPAVRRPQVVILGAGFGGLNAAIGLRNAPVDVTVVDRRNHHLFQPLLYQVATAALSPAQIATPIRRILAGQKNATVLMEKVEGIDTTTRTVLTTSRRMPYDYLVVATGARHAYFGHDAWEEAAPGLKTIADATEIRGRILTAFERAEATEDAALRQKLLTFVVVGGGPTGVELAGAIVELAHNAIVRDFRNIDSSTARVVLVEADKRLLTAFPETLSDSARRQLEKLGVEVRLGAAVTECDDNGVTLADGRHIASVCILWAAGVMASRAAKWLGVPSDRAGRVIVDERLHVPGREGVYVIGDTAAVKGRDGRPVPGVAPAAKQMGRYVASLIEARLSGEAVAPFRYADYGNLATIGRRAAVADLGRIKLGGLPAWLLWSLAHLWFLVGFRNRIVVFLDWAWAYATFDRSARLITGRRER